MTKALTRLTLAALAASLCALAEAAQVPAPPPQTTPAPADAADTWVAVRPAGESFGVLMSKLPVSLEQRVQTDGFSAQGRRYAAAADERTTFVVWSMKGTRGGRRLGAGDGKASPYPGGAAYLDEVAELAWELLVVPEVERLSRDKAGSERLARFSPEMSYVREFELNGRTAREYVVYLDTESGPVYVCADGARVYVLAGLGEYAADPRLKLFANSFAIGAKTPSVAEVEIPSGGRAETPPDTKTKTPSLPVPATIEADPLLFKPEPRAGSAEPERENVGGGDAPADFSRPFKQTEVTQKARITYKPEPSFTEQARRFNVNGVVRLRAVLSSAGEVTGVSVVKGLPHGLTAKAVAAARAVKFQPAQKDGRAVSQYVVFEYNFNIY